MPETHRTPRDSTGHQPGESRPQLVVRRAEGTLPNYTLSTVCPACGTDTFRLACKVRCPRCGFVWDCSEV